LLSEKYSRIENLATLSLEKITDTHVDPPRPGQKKKVPVVAGSLEREQEFFNQTQKNLLKRLEQQGNSKKTGADYIVNGQMFGKPGKTIHGADYIVNGQKFGKPGKTIHGADYIVNGQILGSTDMPWHGGDPQLGAPSFTKNICLESYIYALFAYVLRYCK
jgi:hypothetical protein